MMKKNNFRPITVVFLALFLLLNTGCSTPQEDQEPDIPAVPIVENPVEVPADTPAPEPTPPAAEIAVYELTFTAVWSADSHPGNYDTSAHFSPFIAYSHNNAPDGLIFQLDATASAGMEEMAETGATALLEGEIVQLIAAGSAGSFIKGQRIDSPGVDNGTLEVTQTIGRVTFVSMIAPSPDWFVAADVSLFVDGQWLDELQVELLSYDSGTDDGTSLTAADGDSNPKQVISRLGDALQKMGTISFTRVN